MGLWPTRYQLDSMVRKTHLTLQLFRPGAWEPEKKHRKLKTALLAEGERFELPDLSVCGFQDRRLKPLGHPSAFLEN